MSSGAELDTSAEKVDGFEAGASRHPILIVDLEADGRHVRKRLAHFELDADAGIDGDGSDLDKTENAQAVEALGVFLDVLFRERFTDSRDELTLDDVFLGVRETVDPDFGDDLAF